MKPARLVGFVSGLVTILCVAFLYTQRSYLGFIFPQPVFAKANFIGIFEDSASSAYKLDPAAATSLTVAGKVGIGITTPDSPLTVSVSSSNTSTMSYGNSLFIKNTDNTANNIAALLFGDVTTRLGGIEGVITDHTVGSKDMDMVFTTMSNNAFIEALRIKNNGYVGIGTTSPAANLEIRGTNSDTAGTDLIKLGQAYGAPSLGLRINTTNDPNLDYYTGLTWGTALTILHGSGKVGIGTTNPQSKLSVGGDGYSSYTVTVTGPDAISGDASGVATGGGVYGFSGSTGGQGVYGTAYGTGNGVIGYTSGSGYGVFGWNGGDGNGVEGQSSNGYGIYCMASAANKCGGNQNWFNSNSDRRLKENIKPIDNALAKVLKLQGVYYNLKADNSKTTQIGFIANDVAPVVPEVTGKDPVTGYYGISLEPLTALLNEAIKEQQQEIDGLKKTVDEQGQAIRELQTEVEQLKAQQ